MWKRQFCIQYADRFYGHIKTLIWTLYTVLLWLSLLRQRKLVIFDSTALAPLKSESAACHGWGYEEITSATILHFKPRQQNAVSMTSWGRPQNKIISVSELLSTALVLVGHFPFQISHPIVFINTRVLVRSAVLMFASENMVPIIIVLPRVRKWEFTHNPFIMGLEDLSLAKWEWRNFKGNLSNSLPAYNC